MSSTDGDGDGRVRNACPACGKAWGGQFAAFLRRVDDGCPACNPATFADIP